MQEHFNYLLPLPNQFQKLLGIYSEVESKRKRAVEELLKKYSSATEGPIRNCGPHTISEAQYYLRNSNFQAHIYKIHDDQTVYKTSVPFELDMTKKQIYLLESDTSEGLHVDVIMKPNAFFNRHGQHCLYCGEHWRTTGYRHSCRSIQNQCEACKRPFRAIGSRHHPSLEEGYCRSLIDEIKLSRCSKCNIQMRTVDCQKNHTTMVCRRAFFCTKCEVKFHLNGTERDYQTIAAQHDCSNERCNYCKRFTSRKKLHDCPLWITKRQTYHPNLASISLSHQKRVQEVEKSYSDEEEFEHIDEVNCAILLHEKKGKVSKVVFDKWSCYPDETPGFFEENYQPQDINDVHIPCKTKKKKTKFDQLSVWVEDRPDLVLQKLLDYILNTESEQFLQTTFLVKNLEDLVIPYHFDFFITK